VATIMRTPEQPCAPALRAGVISLDCRATILSHASWGGYRPLILDRGEQRGRRVAVTGIGGDPMPRLNTAMAVPSIILMISLLGLLVPIGTATAITTGGREQV
jgi:hypothetical protein